MGRLVRLGSAIAVAVVLVAAGCSDADDDATTSTTAASDEQATTTAEQLPDLPAPDELGPYAVGRRTIEFRDAERDRVLVTDVWYPVDADAVGEPSVYEFIPGISFESETALADVEVSGDGPFPLVVYSHGSGGLRYIASFYTELLASHGFVVASADHVGNTAVELVTGAETPREEIAYNRALDAQTLITEMLAANEMPEMGLAGSVDAERIGISGHSFGAFTSLASGGGFSNELGSVEADERVKGVVAMAPATRLLSDEQLGAIDVPTLLISATADETTPIETNTERPWELIPGRPLWRVDLTDAGHQSFTDVCQYQELLPTIPDVLPVLIEVVDDYAEEGCADELMPIDQAHDLINRASVSFLLTYVAGESGYEAFLRDELPGETISVEE